MSDIVDLNAERAKREAPDAEFVRHDDFGRPMYCFIAHYQMNGSTWSFQLWAYSAEDAEARLDGIRLHGEISGQIFTAFPA